MKVSKISCGVNIDDKKFKKEHYIEHLRSLATVMVVLLHVVITLPTNFSIKELGLFNSAIFNGTYMITKWTVPCFFMISGALLLRPEKNFNICKIAKYIRRFLMILLIFGCSYAFMELFFFEKEISIKIVFMSFLKTIQGDSWSHLWYIYTLIGIYILVIPLRYAVKYMSEKEFDYLIYILIIGNFLIPTINTLLGLNIQTFMILNIYITYFLLGYWIQNKKNKLGKFIIIPVVFITLFMIIVEIFMLYTNGKTFELNHSPQDIFTFIQSVGVFLFMKEISYNKVLSKLEKNICKCSLGIYLIHPFWINLFYKLFNITPLNFPIGIGIVLLFFIIFMLSILSVMVLKRIPIIKNYI